MTSVALNEFQVLHTGFATKNDSWRIVLNVFFHTALLDIKDLTRFISLKKCLTQLYFTVKLILLQYDCHIIKQLMENPVYEILI